jgi:CHAT domain-containing protein
VAGDSNKDLPGAHRECAAVADKLGVAPIVGKSCTFAAVRDALTAAPEKRLDVVHLAVHWRADARHGGRSSLLFAGHPRTWVPFVDLAALPWNAHLIVLSGCSTAVGGLWPVDDTSAETFMTAFYSELSRRRGTGLIYLRELMDHARTLLRRTTVHRGPKTTTSSPQRCRT